MSSPVAKLQAYDLSIPEPTPVVRCLHVKGILRARCLHACLPQRCVLLLYEQGTQSRRPCHAGLNKHPTAKCFNFPPEYNSGPWVSAQLTDEFFAYVYANQENGLMVRQLSKLRQQIITSLQELLKHWGKPLGDSEAEQASFKPLFPNGPPRLILSMGCEAMNLLLSMLKVDPLSRPNACSSLNLRPHPDDLKAV